jgi:hypothetical protein
VAHMEQVRELSHLPDKPQIPLGCRDEPPVPLLTEPRRPLPAAPGPPAKGDDESERQGTAQIFLCTEPLTGTRPVQVTAPRTAGDWAHQSRNLLAVDSPEAARVRVVCENLNTHESGSLYEAFPPEKARELVKR